MIFRNVFKSVHYAPFMEQIPLQYKNLVAVLYLYGGSSLSRASQILGVSRSAFRNWKKYLGSHVHMVGTSKKSKLHLSSDDLFMNLLREEISNEYFDVDYVFDRVVKRLSEIDYMYNEKAVAVKLRHKLKNYKNVFSAIIEECMR